GGLNLGRMTMIDMAKPIAAGRRLLAAAMIVVATCVGAAAQNVVVIVNGEPITALDVEQRMKFLHLTNPQQKPASRQTVIEELIDEKLKVKEGKRWGVEVSDSEVDTMYATMGQRMRFTA